MDRRRLISNILLAVGLLLVLGAGFSIWWPEYQGQRLRAELLAKRPASGTSKEAAPQGAGPAGASQAILTNPTAAASSTVELPPTLVATEPPKIAPESGAVGRPAGLLDAEPTNAPPSLTPTPTATATPTPTATPTATPIPPSPPVRLVIPDLEIDVKVEEMTWKSVQTANGPVSEWQIPEYAAGHAVNSARLGEPGNIVISGHNNIHGRVFRRISEAWGGEVEEIDKSTERSTLLDGRTVELFAEDGRRFEYVITEFYLVRDSGVPLAQRIANAKFIQPTEGEQVTITTCWPPWNNTHRLILIGTPSRTQESAP